MHASHSRRRRVLKPKNRGTKPKKQRPSPLPNAFCYRIDEVQQMGGPGRTKVYELAAEGRLKLIRLAGITRVDGDSLRALLLNDSE